MESIPNTIEKKLWGISLIIAPLLLAIAQLFWENGQIKLAGGTIQVISFVFWIFAFQGLFNLLRDEMPIYAVIGFAVAVYACIGGNNFGMDGIYEDILSFGTQEARNNVNAKMGVSSLFTLELF